MLWFSIIIWLPIWLLVWIEVDTESVRKAANALRLWWRGVIVRKIGAEHTSHIRHNLYKLARKKGIPHQIAESEFAAREDELQQFFGNAHIDRYEPWLNEEI